MPAYWMNGLFEFSGHNLSGPRRRYAGQMTQHNLIGYSITTLVFLMIDPFYTLN